MALLMKYMSIFPLLICFTISSIFYSPFSRYNLSPSLFSLTLRSMPSNKLPMILCPIVWKSIDFHVSASPLLNPIFTAEMKKSLASFQPSSKVPRISSVLICPKRPALKTAYSNSSMISSYYSILSLRFTAMPPMIALR